MNAKLDTLAKEITKDARLGKKESESLYKELVSDFVERERDLILSGMTQEQVYLAVSGEFGNTRELGKSFYFANQPLSRIPLLGEMLYFRPLRFAILLGVTKIAAYILGFIGSSIVSSFVDSLVSSGVVQDYTSSYYEPNRLINYLAFITFVSVLFIVGSLVGLSIYKKAGNLTELVQAHALLYLPFVVWAFILLSISKLTVAGAIQPDYENVLGPEIIGFFMIDSLFSLTVPALMAGYKKYVKR